MYIDIYSSIICNFLKIKYRNIMKFILIGEWICKLWNM